MPDTITAAIITGSAALLAPMIPLAINGIKRIKENKRFRSIKKETAKDLEGNWICYAKVIDDPQEKRSYNGSIKFKVSRRTVQGTWHIIVHDENTSETQKGWDLMVTGGFIREGFLQLDYWNPNIEIRQFGSLLLELDGNRILKGKEIALGRDLKRIVFCEISFEKQ